MKTVFIKFDFEFGLSFWYRPYLYCPLLITLYSADFVLREMMHRSMEYLKLISISNVLCFLTAQWRNAEELQGKESAEGND